MVANPVRGEFVLTLGGTDYVMRPSFSALVEVESLTGKTLFQLTVNAAASALTLVEAGQVAAAFIRAGAKSSEDIGAAHADAGRIAELIFEAGQPAVQSKLAEVLKAALTGGVNASGEMKPVTVTTH